MRFILVLALALAAPFSGIAHAATDRLAPGVGESAAGGERSSGDRLRLKEDKDTTAELAIRTVGALIVAIGIAVAILILLRRYFPQFQTLKTTADGKRIHLLEIKRLTPRLTLYLISVDGNVHLLAQAGDNVVAIDGRAVSSPPAVGGIHHE